jgi:hypothetical protein
MSRTVKYSSMMDISCERLGGPTTLGQKINLMKIKLNKHKIECQVMLHQHQGCQSKVRSYDLKYRIIVS